MNVCQIAQMKQSILHDFGTFSTEQRKADEHIDRLAYYEGNKNNYSAPNLDLINLILFRIEISQIFVLQKKHKFSSTTDSKQGWELQNSNWSIWLRNMESVLTHFT